MKKINLKIRFKSLPVASVPISGPDCQPAGTAGCRANHRRRAALNVIAGHVARSLPDSISARGELLAALLLVLPKTHRHFPDTLHLQRTLEEHETTRRQLPLLFFEQLTGISRPQPSNPPPRLHRRRDEHGRPGAFFTPRTQCALCPGRFTHHPKNKMKTQTNKRIRLQVTPTLTRPEIELLVGAIASAKNHERLTTSRMDAELAAVRDQYQPALEANAKRLAEMSTAVQAWAEATRRSFTSANRSNSSAARSASAPARPSSRRWAVRLGMRCCRALAPREMGFYLHSRQGGINKEQLMADVSAQSLNAADLLKMGALVVREESFFIDPKLTETETRQVTRAEAA